MSKRKKPKGQSWAGSRATAEYTVSNTTLTGIAVGLALTFAAMVFAFAPRYLQLDTSSVWTVFWIAGAVILGLIGIAGLSYEIYLLKGFVKLAQDAWISASIAVFSALLALSVHLIAVVGLSLTGWLGATAKLIVIAICLLLALALAATIDDFFIKPRLGKKPTRAQRQQRNQIIGSIGAVILWVLTVISTVLTLLDRFFG
jgi:hypothetical protein